MQIFRNDEFGEIRTLIIDGEPWFVGKDVAEKLGYINCKDALLSHVDCEDKRIIQRSENATFEIPNRGLTIINESGLYSLIISSKLPSAKRFKRWVTSEVLPAIRKTGSYAPEYKPTRPLTTDDYLDASRTISKCPSKRLPLVVDLLRKAGLNVEEIKPLTGVRRCEDYEQIQDILNRYSLDEASEKCGICKSSLSYYRRGIHRPSDERCKVIINILG